MHHIKLHVSGLLSLRIVEVIIRWDRAIIMCVYVHVSAAPSGRTSNDSSLCLLKLITIFISRKKKNSTAGTQNMLQYLINLAMSKQFPPDHDVILFPCNKRFFLHHARLIQILGSVSFNLFFTLYTYRMNA